MSPQDANKDITHSSGRLPRVVRAAGRQAVRGDQHWRQWPAASGGATVFIDYEGDKDKVYSTAGKGETFATVMTRRLSRRHLMQGAAASAVVIAGVSAPTASRGQEASPAAGQMVPPAGTPRVAMDGELTFSAIS